MRLVFACTACGIHYLPPASMTWSDGTTASPLWCSVHHAAATARGIAEPPAAAAAALAAARMRSAASSAGRADQADHAERRPSRPARTRRAGRTSTSRNKLK
ncbi:hypothetical protein ACFW1A_23650 [Kitasatospora sp. NPDC058965]|uniref:hypothetical protein n=1 Tax=Kitasatospora sp. NPDC058965 TaxID=3346682 RepID=UPI0036BA40B4